MLRTGFSFFSGNEPIDGNTASLRWACVTQNMSCVACEKVKPCVRIQEKGKMLNMCKIIVLWFYLFTDNN